MWEPVEVDEWVEDVRHDDGRRSRVWYTQVTRLDVPDAPVARTACGLYGLGQHGPMPLYDDDLREKVRRTSWYQYSATGFFPRSAWSEAPFDPAYRHRYTTSLARRRR